MRHRLGKRGFTIIETMIFLTVSAVVFLGGIQQYSAQQRTVEANQGFRTLQSQLTSLANEVASSFRPDLGTNYCKASTDGLNSPVTFDGIADTAACVYLGQVFSFGGPSSYCSDSNADDCGKYNTAPIVGRRLVYTGVPGDRGADVATYNEAKPIVPNISPSLVKSDTLLNGIGIRKAFIRSATGSDAGGIGAFAFVLSLTGDGGSSGQVDLIALDTPFFNNNMTNTTAAVAAMLAVTPATVLPGTAITRVNPQYGIALCLVSGSGQSTEITVGANNSPVDIQVVPTSKIDSDCIAS